MVVIQPPNDISLVRACYRYEYPTIFLGGSIEMGAASDWQMEVCDKCTQYPAIFANPRRKNWDCSWEQTIGNPNFKEQVEWEINGLDICDCVFFYFDPNTKAPITLMEYGLHIKTNKPMIVVCPDGFWRKGNIEVTMNMFRPHEKILNSLNDGVNSLHRYINHFRCA